MSTRPPPHAPDFAAITARQQQTSGPAATTRPSPRASRSSRELLCDAADLRAGQPRARRRRRQRQHRPGRRPLRRPGRLARLRALPARAGARARRGRGPRSSLSRATPRRCRSPTRSFDAVISVVGVDVRARPAADGGRDAARLPPRRHDRPGQLDARGLHRRALPDVGAHVPPPAGLHAAAALGHRGPRARLLGDGVRDLRARRRTYTFRFDVAGGLRRASSATYYGPTLMAFDGARRPRASARSRPTSPRWPRFDRLGGDGPVAIPAEYLEVVATRGASLAAGAAAGR